MVFSMLKRDLRLFLRCLVPALALTLAFALACTGAAFAAARAAGGLYTPVKAAVVDREDSLVSRMAVNVVQGMDYISGLMEVERCSMDEAMEGLEAGAYAAVIVLPENFTVDISRGEESRGQIILSPAAASNAPVVESAARFGELLLAAGQYGVFSGERLIREYALGQEFHSAFLTESNTRLMGEALNAQDNYFDIEVTDYAGTSMSGASFFALSWLTLALFLCAIFFAKLYTTDMTRPMLCRLKAAGVTDRAFLLGKVLYPALLRLLLLAAVLAVLSRFLDLELSALTLLSGLAGVLVLSLVSAALCMGGKSPAALVAIVSAAGLFLCGGIVPRQMMPQGLLAVGTLTPSGAVQALLAPLFGGELSLASAGAALAYALASLLWLRRRLSALRVGGEEE